MIHGRKLKPILEKVGSFTSTPGAKVTPFVIPENRVLFELVMEGAVYGFEEEPVLHGVGSVFVHQPGECTISETEPGGYYGCMTAMYVLDRMPSAVSWPRCFLWDDAKLS